MGAARALEGWVKPGDAGGWPGKLNDTYYPGDIGFDPLGLKPESPAEFAEMATKELQHGRLAMLASAGFIAQELVNETPIIENLCKYTPTRNDICICNACMKDKADMGNTVLLDIE